MTRIGSLRVPAQGVDLVTAATGSQGQGSIDVHQRMRLCRPYMDRETSPCPPTQTDDAMLL